MRDLFLGFESVGDNCELAMAQRHFGAEEGGVLRWARSFSIKDVILLIERGFDGIFHPSNLLPCSAGMVEDTSCGVHFHTEVTSYFHDGIWKSHMPEDARAAIFLREREKMRFLARRTLGHLREANRIFVYKENTLPAERDVLTLVDAIRRYGNNRLLWVVEAPDCARPDVVFGDDAMIVGQIPAFADYDEMAGKIATQDWADLLRLVRGTKQALRTSDFSVYAASGNVAVGETLVSETVKMALDVERRGLIEVRTEVETDQPNSTGQTNPASGEVDIWEVADATLEIGRKGPIEMTTRVDVGKTFLEEDGRIWFRPATTSSAVKFYRLQGLSVDMANGVMILHKTDLKIRQGRYLSNDEGYAKSCTTRRQPIRLGGERPFLLCFNAAWRNHYHFLVQTIATLDAANDIFDGQVNLFLPPLTVAQDGLISLADCQSLPRLTPPESGCYRFDDVFVSSLLIGENWQGVCPGSAATFARIRNRVTETTAQSRLIYVSREDATARRMVNEDEVASFLWARGFEIVLPSKLGIVEQIRIFSEARIVIGAHGAGLANVAFCRPGTHIYEIFPRRNVVPCFPPLAQAARLHYWCDVFESWRSENGVDLLWAIEMEVFEARVEDLLNVALSTKA